MGKIAILLAGLLLTPAVSAEVTVREFLEVRAKKTEAGGLALDDYVYGLGVGYAWANTYI